MFWQDNQLNHSLIDAFVKIDLQQSVMFRQDKWPIWGPVKSNNG